MSGMKRLKHIYLSLMLVFTMLVSALLPAVAATADLAMDPAFAERAMGETPKAAAISKVSEPASLPDTGKIPCHGLAEQNVQSSSPSNNTPIRVAGASIPAAHDCLQCCLSAPKSLIVGLTSFHPLKQVPEANKLKALVRLSFLDQLNLSDLPLATDAPPLAYFDAVQAADYSLLIERTQRFRL